MSGEVLELSIPTKDIQIEEVGERVMWGLTIEQAPEGPPLAPLTEALNAESGAVLAQEDGAAADDDAMA